MSGEHKRAGEAIGPYRVESLLGQGGMGVVYRATGPDGRQAAVKVLLPPRGRPEVYRRFEREARIRIDHPNVVEVLDTGVDDAGAPWIAFELLDGESLRVRLKRGPLGTPEAVDMAVQACAGLDAAHQRGIVHRDLKPGNLLLGPDGTLKLLDFGIARWSEVEPELTTDRQVLGTPYYLAPEQARGDSSVDERADVWSLGVVLYEALSGVRPFGRDSAVASMLAVVLDEPTPLPAVAPHVPPELAKIVERAIQKSPEERWPSANALREALEELEPQQLEQAHPGPPRTRTSVPSSQTRVDSRRGERASLSGRSSTGIRTGEKRVVAMLLADGVSDAHAIEQVIQQHGGAFVPLLGRRAIGLFGGEAWEGDEVLRAARAGLQARQVADHVSVASGRAAAKGEGIAGDAVLEAERGAAVPMDGVAVIGEAARVLRSDFELEAREEGIHEIRAERAPSTTASLLEQEELVPVVGREKELEGLERTARAALQQGRAHAVWVTGPPGIGKSRLRREMERILHRLSSERGPVRVLSGRAEPLGRETALSLIGSALQIHARQGAVQGRWPSIDPTGGELAERQQAVRAFVRDAVGEDERADRCADFLGTLLGVSMPDTAETTAARRDLRLMADRLKLSVHDYFGGLTQQQPVALVLEDVQWADHSSLDLLEDMVERLSDRPLLVWVSSRPELLESRPKLFRGVDLQRIELPRLERTAVASLAEQIVGVPLADSLVDAVTERTGGNPLFVEHIVRALDEERLLERAPERLPLPLTVEAAVQSRLDHLPAEEKDLCKRASLFGRLFVPSELEALGVADASRHLGSLRSRELVVVVHPRPGGEKQYRFRSSIIGEVAYRMLSDELRRELHLAAAEHLAASSESDREEIAVHYERAGRLSEAAAYFAEAAAIAARQGDSQKVLRCGDRSVELGPPTAHAFEVHMARAEAFGFLGHREDQGLALAEAADCAERDDQRAQARVAQATWLTRTSRLSDALEAAGQAVELADRIDDSQLRVMARVRHAAALIFSGRLSEAEELLRGAEMLAKRVGPHPRAFVSEWGAHLASARGDLGERQRAFSETVVLFRRAGDVRRAAANETNLADTYNRVGAYEQAVDALRDALEGCRRVGNRPGEAYALLNLAYALGELGQTGDALRALDEAQELPPLGQDVRLSLTQRLYRVRVQLGRADEATLARQAEALASKARQHGIPALRVAALTLAARAWLDLGEGARALQNSSEAMAERDLLGSVEEDEAEVFLAHADALLACGHGDEANETILRGQSRLQYIAARIGDKTWRRRFLQEVPVHRELLSRGG